MITFQQKNIKGFTLIEVLTVLSIIGIMAAVAFPVYAHIQRNTLLRTTVDEIAAQLQFAHTNAVTAQNGSNWGIHLDATNHQYTIYRGQWPASTVIETHALDSSLVIPETVIEYQRLTGTTTPLTITITGYGQTEQIEIFESGNIVTQ